MKKTLIALAALASTAAFAQSSVTISGRIDLGHANLKTTTTPTEGGAATLASTVKGSSLSGDQHGRTTSRLTFSGVEDLGGGLKAAFNYEVRLNPDNTGDGNGMGGTRNAFLNLSGGFGSVTVGTFLNSVDTLRGYSAGTYSAAGGDFLPDHGGLSGRSTNAIAYRSPSFGGAVVAVGVFSENSETQNSTGVVTANAKTQGTSLAVSYNAGPISAHAVTASAKGRTLAAAVAANVPGTVGFDATKAATFGSAAVDTDAKQTTSGFAVSYDIGMAKPYFAMETGKTTPAVSAVSTNTKYNAWELGATFPMGAFTPYVLIGQGKIKGLNAGVENSQRKTSAFQVGTTYALSKRTYVYGAVGQQKDTQQLNAATLPANRTAKKESGYKLGLVHSF